MRTRDHRSSTRESFGENDAEWFIPFDRYNHGGSRPQQIIFLLVIYLADVFDAFFVQTRLYLSLPIGFAFLMGDAIAGEYQATARRARQRDSGVGALDAF